MAFSIEEQKEKIREEIRNRRQALSPEEKAIMDGRVRTAMEALSAFRDASDVFTYIPLPGEPDTLELIQLALAHGKPVYAPVSDPKTFHIRFYRIRSFADLKPGAYGVREPDPAQAEPAAVPSVGSACLVPGLAFDRRGFRVGYGKGYYDRYLERFPGVRIGICYLNNVFDQLPRGPHDQSVDWLVTENGSIRINHREEKQI